ncbi:hypothetical protein DF186_14255, partial [Enterococcus hirae]
RLQIFDSEIERTISRIRQTRRRLIRSENRSENRLEEKTSSRSTDLINSRTDDITEPRRITIQKKKTPNFTIQPFQTHHPAVTTDFKIKTAPLNLIPKFHNLLTQKPIKHLKNFQTTCSTV